MAARILVVEQDSDVRDLIVAALRGQEYEPVVASSGEEALRLLPSEHIDLVCFEVTLPGMDGFEAAEQLLANRATREIPFIFLTDRKSLHDRVRGLRIGAHAYVTKPFAFPELFATIDGILRRVQRRLAAPGVVGLMGSLSDMGIGAVLQAIEHEQRTGLLNVTSSERWGRVTFCAGKIVAAEAGRAQGEEAICELVHWHEGSYAFRPQPVSPAPPIAESCTSILVRAYQQYDEGRAGSDVEEPPNPTE
jgi:DNA-binding response OmpR family regulator